MIVLVVRIDALCGRGRIEWVEDLVGYARLEIRGIGGLLSFVGGDGSHDELGVCSEKQGERGRRCEGCCERFAERRLPLFKTIASPQETIA